MVDYPRRHTGRPTLPSSFRKVGSLNSFIGKSGGFLTIHKADADCPDHHLLPRLESQLLLDSVYGVPHCQPAVVPYLAYLIIGQSLGKHLQYLFLTVR